MEGEFMVDKLLTRRGWRVVAHSLLATAGIGLLYILSGMVISGIRHGHPSNWWIIGGAMAVSIWMVVLGCMLAKAELTEKK
jgi:hypothetical protein